MVAQKYYHYFYAIGELVGTQKHAYNLSQFSIIS